jgi:hypothetical protein
MIQFNQKTFITLFLLTAFLMVSFPLPARASCSCCKGNACKCNCPDTHELQEKLLQHQGNNSNARCTNCWHMPERDLLPGTYNNPLEKKPLLAAPSRDPLLHSLLSRHPIKTCSIPPAPHGATPLFLINASFLL